MPPRKPYTLTEAAAVIGMSRDWLRERLAESAPLREAAFRTKGKAGHYRFHVDPFQAWWKAHQEASAVAKPTRPRRQRSKATALTIPTGATGAKRFLAALRAA